MSAVELASSSSIDELESEGGADQDKDKDQNKSENRTEHIVSGESASSLTATIESSCSGEERLQQKAKRVKKLSPSQIGQAQESLKVGEKKRNNGVSILAQGSAQVLGPATLAGSVSVSIAATYIRLARKNTAKKAPAVVVFSWNAVIAVARRGVFLELRLITLPHGTMMGRTTGRTDRRLVLEVGSKKIAREWHAAMLRGLSRSSNFDVLANTNVLAGEQVPAEVKCEEQGGRRLLVLVNPASGKRKGPKTLARVQELLEQAYTVGTVEVQTTTHVNHAYEIVQTVPLAGLDGIITVSGDGLLYEVVNGLLSRVGVDVDDPLTDLPPIGTIPAGTGNALSSALGAFNDPFTAVLHIAKGHTAPLDLFRVQLFDKNSDKEDHEAYPANEHVVWGFLNVAWAIVADVDAESEKYRWAGQARYDFGAISQILGLKKYWGRLRVLSSEVGSPDNESQPCSVAACTVCATHRDDPTFHGRRSFHFKHLAQANSPKMISKKGRQGKKKKPAKSAKSANKKQDRTDLNLEDGIDFNHPFLHLDPTVVGVETEYLSKRQQRHWETIEGDFTYFVASKVAWMASDLQSHPHAHLGDGYMDVVYSQPGHDFGRRKLISMFGEMEDGSYVKDPSVIYRKTRAFTLEPGGRASGHGERKDKPGHLMVDGEHLPYSPAGVEVIPHVIRVFCAPPPLEIPQHATKPLRYS